MAERTYTVPLRRGFSKTPRYKRTNKAVRVLREFLQKHTKADEVKLGQHLNAFLWERGIRNPPPRVRVTVTMKDGVALAELEGKKFTRIEPPQERQEQPQGLKERLQSMTQKDAVEEAQEALEPEEPKKDDSDEKPKEKKD